MDTQRKIFDELRSTFPDVSAEELTKVLVKYINTSKNNPDEDQRHAEILNLCVNQLLETDNSNAEQRGESFRTHLVQSSCVCVTIFLPIWYCLQMLVSNLLLFSCIICCNLLIESNANGTDKKGDDKEAFVKSKQGNYLYSSKWSLSVQHVHVYRVHTIQLCPGKLVNNY